VAVHAKVFKIDLLSLPQSNALASFRPSNVADAARLWTLHLLIGAIGLALFNVDIVVIYIVHGD
jgi:hypothetical protein